MIINGRPLPGLRHLEIWMDLFLTCNLLLCMSEMFCVCVCICVHVYMCIYVHTYIIDAFLYHVTYMNLHLTYEENGCTHIPVKPPIIKPADSGELNQHINVRT